MYGVILLVVIAVSFILSIWFRRPERFPPGQHGLLALKRLLFNPQQYFEWTSDTYGGLSGIVIPGHKLVIASSKKAIMEVLSNPSCQGRPDNCLLRDRLDGKNAGIFFTEGPPWKENRKFLINHLRNFGFGQSFHEELISEQRDFIISHIRELKGKSFSIEDLMYLPNINVIWGLIGGQTFNFAAKELSTIRQALKDIIHSISIVGGLAVFFPFMRYVAPEMTGYKRFISGYRELRSFSTAIINQHRKTLDPDKPRDIIDIYLIEIANNSNEVEGFTDLDIEGMCVDMLTAAHTTVVTLTFAILHLCENPIYQKKIYADINRAVGPNARISYEDRTKMVYTEAFLMELLRCKTPAPTGTPHSVMEDTIISGYFLPKHCVVFVNFRSMFMSKVHWNEPNIFRPERFINEENMTIKTDECLIPFSKGKRSCFGEAVAKRVMFMWLTSLVQNFNISFPTGFKLASNAGEPTFIASPPRFQIVCTPRNV